MPTSSTRPHLPKGEAIPSGPDELPTSCNFSSISREIRDIIYGDLITSKNLEVLRVSKQVHDEAKDVLYRLGIYRLNLSCAARLCRYDYLKLFEPPETLPENVRNFNFNIAIDQYRFDDDRLGPSFRPSVRGSRDCHITLDFQGYGHFRVPVPVYKLIESLSTSRLVTLRIHFAYRLHPMDRRNKDDLEPLHAHYLQTTATEFSAVLGDPIWRTDTYPGNDYEMLAHERLNPFPNAQYLEFHPRKKKRLSAEPTISLPRVKNNLEDNAHV